MRIVKNIVLAGLAAGAAASPASAAIVICNGNCLPGGETVQVIAQTTNTTIGQNVFGASNSSNVGVIFSSTTDVIQTTANGQAVVSSKDGLLNNLTFSLAGGFGFAAAVFNLNPIGGQPVPNEAGSVIITYYAPGLGQQTISVGTNGQNFMGISGNAGEIFTSVGFTGNPASDGIGDFRQLRLLGIQAVPEPSTWALFILGFGVLGGAMRRRTRKFAEARAALA